MNSLTEQIRASIVEAILEGKYLPGGKLPTEREYAEQTGTSRVTVRRAYALLETAGIILRHPHAGTRVTEAFRAQLGPLEKVGVITTLPHEFSGHFVQAVSRCCAELDAIMALGIPEPDTTEEQMKIAIRMVSHGIRDLVVWGADRNCDFEVFRRLRILGVNLVFFDQVIPGNYADYVGLDNGAAIRALFQHAVDSGFRHFLFVTYSDMEVDSNEERENAFRKCVHSGEYTFRVVRTPRHTSLESPEAMALQKMVTAGMAVIGVNYLVLRQSFRMPIPGVCFYCVDAPSDPALHAIGYRQPISKMAACAVKMLLGQRKKGEHWKATQRRWKGELVLP